MRELCPLCNHVINRRREYLTRGLVKILIKCHSYKIDNVNQFRPQKDLGLTKSEYNNFQKLKYHGIVEQFHRSGMWRITDRGLSFFLGEISLPKYVLVNNNSVYDKSIINVFISDILLDKNSKYFETNTTVEYE